MRVDEVDIPQLRALQAEHGWFRLTGAIGRGHQRVLRAQFTVPAFAWSAGQGVPDPRPGPWPAQIALARGLAVQPLVQLLPDDQGCLPASGSISDWDAAGEHGPGRHVYPGLVCYASHWNPTHVTLGWLVFQVARIITGEVLNLEARALSTRGRDFQASALAQGKLPTQMVPVPRQELLFLHGWDGEPCRGEIEFDEA